MFAHDNRVIHHDPQRDDQREKRDDVDRQAKGVHQRDTCGKRDGDAHRHPKRRPGREEKEQQRHDEREADSRIIDQQSEAIGNNLGPRIDRRYRDTRRQARLHLASDLAHDLFERQCIALGGTLDPHLHGGVFTHEISALPVDPLHPDGRYITHGQGGAIAILTQHDGRDFLGGSFCRAGSNARSPRDIARRVRRHFLSNRGRNLGHADVVPDQRKRRHLNNGRGGRNTHNAGPRDARLKQAAREFIGEPAQLIHRHRAADDNIRHPVRETSTPQRGIIGIFWQRRNTIKNQLNILSRPVDIVARLKLERDRGPRFCRVGRRRRDTIHGE